ncbi:PTS IIA-like nitrogen regulatory protein PtsN [Echinimonas agarilytica]|uniref:PTS IIA-like nitrogen regulatory protein PtsN n=1 Tax=Echinimonas agarilytica TaxID=1215918 RepID=A0AA42B6F9_9GAMM|nr:PTS IIA-like nitrogen regulatory protein PtsN [Echinimonas agarilytica]MCM2678609.1 PTS IIA-like nitrogen regulatory protein PtsN [Echinimonas agarilytica]
MNMRSILSKDCTFSAVQCSSKKRALEIVSEIAAKHLQGLTENEIFERFLAREKLGSTGIGNGIAIPHGRLPSDASNVAILVQFESPIEFDAIDKKPVDIMFAMLVPEQDCKHHLKTLALVAEKLGQKNTLKQLRCASSAEDLYQVIINA